MLRSWICFALLIAATLSIWRREETILYCIQAGLLVTAAAAPRLPEAVPARRSILLLAAAAVWGIGQLALGRSASPSSTIEECLFWASLAAVHALVAPLEANLTRLGKILKAAALFAVVLCAFSLVQFFTSEGKIFWVWPSGEPQAAGPFQSRNNYASFGLLTFPLVAWHAVQTKRTNWNWLSAAALIAASVFTSGSRAGAALMLLQLPVFLFLIRRRIQGRLLLVAAGLIVLTAGALSFTGWDLLANKLYEENPFRYRKEMTAAAVSMAVEQPLAGYGLGTFPSVYPAFALFDSGHFVNHAHNDWAEWASEGGLPYLLILLTLAIVTLRSVPEAPWSLGIAAVYAHALVDYPMQRLGVAGWVILIAALASMAGKRLTASGNRDEPALPRSAYYGVDCAEEYTATTGKR
jgi:O-antigen ligase